MTTDHFVLPLRLGFCESWWSKESGTHAPSLPIVLQPGKGYGRRSTRSDRTPRICRPRFFGWLSLAVSEQSVHLKPLSLLRKLPCHGSGRRSQVVTRPTILRIEPLLGPLHQKGMPCRGVDHESPDRRCQMSLLTDSPGYDFSLSREKSQQDHGHGVFHRHEHCPSRVACLWTRFSQRTNQGWAQGNHLIQPCQCMGLARQMDRQRGVDDPRKPTVR